MTLVEFLAPLKKGKHQDRILAVLYYRERYEHVTSISVEELRHGLRQARAPGWRKVNVADVLSKSGELVDTAGVAGRKRLWGLTDSGREHVRQLLGLPEADVEIEHDVGTLQALVLSLPDEDLRSYLEEGLKCLQVGALRACVVFVWVAAMRSIQSSILAKGAKKATQAIQTHDPKNKGVGKVDDFAYVKDATTLLAARDLGVLDKNEKDVLSEALSLRNRCGHPGKYRPGIKKVSAFVEDVTSIVFM